MSDEESPPKIIPFPRRRRSPRVTEAAAAKAGCTSYQANQRKEQKCPGSEKTSKTIYYYVSKCDNQEYPKKSLLFTFAFHRIQLSL